MLTDFQVALRLLVSVVLSGLIGFERQFHHRNAGLRTHIMVCLGSCLMMLTSIYIFDIYKDIVPLDPVRLAAGVITGIGFLGAGTIMRDQTEIKGLTTAASLWVAAGIGLAIGCGFYSGAIFSTCLALIVLLVLRRAESLVFEKIHEPEKHKK